MHSASLLASPSKRAICFELHLRIQVNLTDGRTVQLGCVNTTAGHTGCTPGQLDVGIRQAAFSFAPGERVTALSLFAGPDNGGTANARAGAIRFSTSLVRV